MLTLDPSHQGPVTMPGEVLHHSISPSFLPDDVERHDNDHKLPRTPKEIYDLNKGMAAKMKEVFWNKGIPVVPSLGMHLFVAF